MLTLPKKTPCALEAVMYIASQPSARPVSSREIAEVFQLPVRYLEPILQKLVHERFLRGMRGPRGGYVLARERRRMTLADLVRALSDEEENLPGSVFASPAGQELLGPIWQRMEEQMLQTLGDMTLADLLDGEDMPGWHAEAGAEEKGRRDFTI